METGTDSVYMLFLFALISRVGWFGWEKIFAIQIPLGMNLISVYHV